MVTPNLTSQSASISTTLVPIARSTPVISRPNLVFPVLTLEAKGLGSNHVSALRNQTMGYTCPRIFVYCAPRRTNPVGTGTCVSREKIALYGPWATKGQRGYITIHTKSNHVVQAWDLEAIIQCFWMGSTHSFNPMHHGSFQILSELDKRIIKGAPGPHLAGGRQVQAPGG